MYVSELVLVWERLSDDWIIIMIMIGGRLYLGAPVAAVAELGARIR